MTEHVRDPIADCIGKEKHTTKALASEIASRMASRRQKNITAYKCPHCGFYHVGQSTSKGKTYGRYKW